MGDGSNLSDILEFLKIDSLRGAHTSLFVFVTVMENEGEELLSRILLDAQHGHVSGLDDINIPITQQETQTSPEVEDVASRGNKGTKRSKNFNINENELICEGWLIASKDPIHGANQNRTGFWGNVHGHFEKHNKGTTPRMESSILHALAAFLF
jgi:hypothetical protein